MVGPRTRAAIFTTIALFAFAGALIHAQGAIRYGTWQNGITFPTRSTINPIAPGPVVDPILNLPEPTVADRSTRGDGVPIRSHS